MSNTILIVDDVYSNRYLLEQILIQYHCLSAANGKQMWDILRTTIPDLIIMDIGLPGEDGLSLVRRLKGEERLKAVPVIFLTAHAGRRDIIEGMRAGGFDYLIKPVDDMLLLERIRNVLDKQKPGKATPPSDDVKPGGAGE
jgi:DNA-binding response OmpR family regulator